MSGSVLAITMRSDRTASEGHDERIGVCRDFAHLAVTLCRCMNIPARYCTGYLGDIGVPPDPAPAARPAWPACVKSMVQRRQPFRMSRAALRPCIPNMAPTSIARPVTLLCSRKAAQFQGIA
jgi:hypothetical protein